MPDKQSTPSLKFDDVRRLTGPNLFCHSTAAVIDVSVVNEALDSVLQAWEQKLKKVVNSLGWQNQTSHRRCYSGGISFVIEAPIDQLYTACDILEYVWRLTCDDLAQPFFASFEHETSVILNYPSNPSFDTVIEQLKQISEAEKNPVLTALQTAANTRNKPFLWDDDEVSIGYGKGVQVFNHDQLPQAEAVNWNAANSLVCALITGTNGKSTSVRLAAKIAEAAGISAGITSTDFIRVGKEILDHGDYSGPAGARMLLRHPKTEIAFLEVARGGLLRRGLPVQQVNAALITNVAADHLGDYGINSVEEMTEAKFIVAKGLAKNGVLVLNADDENIVAYSQKIKSGCTKLDPQISIFWFSLDQQNLTIQQHIKAGGTAIYAKKHELVFAANHQSQSIVAIDDIPMTMHGAAQHNIQNAMGVIGLCKALNIDNQFIHAGLTSFQSDQIDNPGRGNDFSYNGARVFVDFAHNEHSINAIVSTLKNIPAKRRLVLLCQAGDRSDDDIYKLTQKAAELNPQHFIVCELPNYLRGRSKDEVSQVIYQHLLTLQFDDSQIEFAETPLMGAKKALEWCRKGDLMLLLALSDRDEIFKLLTTV